MSNQRRLKRAAARNHALLANRISGCTCRPDVEQHGIHHITLAHDHDCPMVDHVSQLIAFISPRGCGGAK
ncbi:MAG: hypothetical protein AB7R77_05950 [Ilumatobacteraceae bacterium]